MFKSLRGNLLNKSTALSEQSNGQWHRVIAFNGHDESKVIGSWARQHQLFLRAHRALSAGSTSFNWFVFLCCAEQNFGTAISHRRADTPGRSPHTQNTKDATQWTGNRRLSFVFLPAVHVFDAQTRCNCFGCLLYVGPCLAFVSALVLKTATDKRCVLPHKLPLGLGLHVPSCFSFHTSLRTVFHFYLMATRMAQSSFRFCVHRVNIRHICLTFALITTDDDVDRSDREVIKFDNERLWRQTRCMKSLF